MSSAVAAFLHTICTRLKIVEKVAQNLLPELIPMIQVLYCRAIHRAVPELRGFKFGNEIVQTAYARGRTSQQEPL